jgi:hypothetical protein
MTAMQERRVTFPDGAPALAVGYADNVLHLICEAAFPPGKPLSLQLQLDGQALALQGKSAGSKRRADQRYDVKLRLFSLRRDERGRLEQAFPATAATDS